MDQDHIPAYIQYLMDADAYPHPVADILLIQTHISFVVLAGAYVYKWKKPVNFGFVNFSTLARRKYYCGQELSLNRRLCPDIYLGVVTLTREGGSFRLDGVGEIVEYGVKMLRMPAGRMMDRLLQDGLLAKCDLDGIVAKLVPFYERSGSSARIGRFGSVREVSRSVMENLDQTRRFIGEKGLEHRRFRNICDFAVDFLANHRLFEKRMAEGRIRDCHGDLHAANICLADEIHIFDCIEFSRRLRCVDIAADVAFLAMDLDLHGLPKLSEYFIDQFVLASGDTGLAAVLDFYKCYRAYVRGKINLLTAVDVASDARKAEQCRERAGRCFALAESYARSAGRRKR